MQQAGRPFISPFGLDQLASTWTATLKRHAQLASSSRKTSLTSQAHELFKSEEL